MSIVEDKVRKLNLVEIDREALPAGRQFIDDHTHIGFVSQPDSFA